MADSSFRHKKTSRESTVSFLKGFSSSLALRVFFITLAFLVVPLLFYCGMVYRYETALKKAQEARSLGLIAEIQILTFEQFVKMELEVMAMAEGYMQDFLLQGQKDAATAALLLLKRFEEIEEAFVLGKVDNDQVQCLLSSGEIKKNVIFNQLFFNTKLAVNDYIITMPRPVPGGANILYFTKVLRRGSKGEVLNTLNLGISIEAFMKYLTKAQGYAGGYKVSLFNNLDNIVFASQEEMLIGKKLIFDDLSNKVGYEDALLRSVPKVKNTYEFLLDNAKLYATVLPLASMNFTVLITAHQYSYSYYLKEFFYQTMLLLACIITFGGVGSLILTYLMAYPLKHLCFVMKQVGEEDLTARYIKSVYGFEINNVGAIFNKTIEDLIRHLHKIEQQKIKHEKLKQELLIGHEIQKSLVPTTVPNIPGIDIQTVLIPAKEVGGDFYDFFISPERKDELFLMMADTSGHGVFGCFYSLTMRSILRSLSNTISDLKEVIVKANELFCKDSGESYVFVTAWIGSYHYKTRVLEYSSCGHPLGFVFRQGVFFKELSTPGIALGVQEQINPVMERIQLEAGDLLILITDGIIETRNNAGSFYGKKKFIETIEKYCHLRTQEIFENVIHDIEVFEENSENQEDDFTMLMIRIQ